MGDIFSDVLVANSANGTIPPEYNWYSGLIGAWDFEWVDHKDTHEERHIPGEWIFSWVIEGQALQDVFICPSREAREVFAPPEAEYGTTLRIFNPEKQVWTVLYTVKGEVQQFTVSKDEVGRIVHECIGGEGVMVHWIFSDMTPDSFRWSNILSLDQGESWQVQGELFATRKVRKSVCN